MGGVSRRSVLNQTLMSAVETKWRILGPVSGGRGSSPMEEELKYIVMKKQVGDWKKGIKWRDRRKKGVRERIQRGSYVFLSRPERWGRNTRDGKPKP